MFRIFFAGLLLIAITSNAQFKADNVKYTTVFPEELCKTLMANQGYTLLDVRSQGEYDDTSTAGGLNIGHMKNSMHIDIRELPKRWKELSAYKDKPLFIYCSHSQRSRRAGWCSCALRGVCLPGHCPCCLQSRIATTLARMRMTRPNRPNRPSPRCLCQTYRRRAG